MKTKVLSGTDRNLSITPEVTFLSNSSQKGSKQTGRHSYCGAKKCAPKKAHLRIVDCNLESILRVGCISKVLMNPFDLFNFLCTGVIIYFNG